MPRFIAWALSIVLLAGPAPLLAADEDAKGPSATGSAAQAENANKQSEEGATRGQERAAERRHVEEQAKEKKGKWADKSEKSKKKWRDKQKKKGEVGGKERDEAAKEWQANQDKAKKKAAERLPATPEVPAVPELPGTP